MKGKLYRLLWDMGKIVPGINWVTKRGVRPIPEGAGRFDRQYPEGCVIPGDNNRPNLKWSDRPDIAQFFDQFQNIPVVVAVLDPNDAPEYLSKLERRRSKVRVVSAPIQPNSWMNCRHFQDIPKKNYGRCRWELPSSADLPFWVINAFRSAGIEGEWFVDKKDDPCGSCNAHERKPGCATKD